MALLVDQLMFWRRLGWLEISDAIILNCYRRITSANIFDCWSSLKEHYRRSDHAFALLMMHPDVDIHLLDMIADWPKSIMFYDLDIDPPIPINREIVENFIWWRRRSVTYAEPYMWPLTAFVDAIFIPLELEWWRLEDRQETLAISGNAGLPGWIDKGHLVRCSPRIISRYCPMLTFRLIQQLDKSPTDGSCWDITRLAAMARIRFHEVPLLLNLDHHRTPQVKLNHLYVSYSCNHHLDWNDVFSHPEICWDYREITDRSADNRVEFEKLFLIWQQTGSVNWQTYVRRKFYRYKYPSWFDANQFSKKIARYWRTYSH